VVTVTSTTPVPGGETAAIEVGELTVKLLAPTDPNFTAVAPMRPVPLMVTKVPPASPPLLGLTLMSAGAGEPVAKPCDPPAETAETPLRPLTGTGTWLASVPPLPSCPSALAPQAMTVPSLSSARLSSLPADTALTPLRPLTGTGTWLASVPPLPSCPSALAPQAMTVPSLSSARLSSLPADTALTPLRPLTGTGTWLN
jgi:predicted RNase H-like HicB family nuclease